MRPEYLIADAAGRISRRLGRGGGTSLPGRLALALREQATAELARELPRGIVVVSATNGKTTTARLIRSAIAGAGWPSVANTAGANLVSGVTTALLAARRQRPRPQVGLFEVDEAALPDVIRRTAPRVVVLMNLFRDQLDRYGELESLLAAWRVAVADLPADTTLVLNADDPAIAGLLAIRPDALTFGICDLAIGRPGLDHAVDSTRCPRCEATLVYDLVTMGHLGHWRCPSCGNHRPRPAVRATSVTLDGLDGQRLVIAVAGGEIAVDLRLAGVPNAYNATAAVAAATALGIAPGLLAPALAGRGPAFGRGERLAIDGRELTILLAKNPAGANENVRLLLLLPAPVHVLALLNDRTADGRDVSWIWDVDYEPLLPALAHLTIGGDRAHDLALRFRYAGLAGERMTVCEGVGPALAAALAAAPEGGQIYALPTYTAMLELRRDLVRRGVADHFWRDA